MWLIKAHTSQEAPTSTSGSSSRQVLLKDLLDKYQGNIQELINQMKK